MVKEKDKKLVESFNLDKEVEETVLDFIDMRNLIKKPMTDRAIKMLINKVQKMSSNPSTQVLIIEQSILNNWTDIYPTKSFERTENKNEWTTVE